MNDVKILMRRLRSEILLQL